MQLVKNNLKFLGVFGLAAALFASGCGLLPSFDFGPRTAEAQYTPSSDPAIAANERIAHGVANVGRVADGVAVLPTPASPIAAGVGSFSEGYSSELLRRLDRIEQRQAEQAARGEAVQPAQRSEILQSQIAAFLAGLSALLIRTKSGRAIVLGNGNGNSNANSNNEQPKA